MIYGYVRVSTDKQDTDNQTFEINHFCEKNNLHIDKWMKDDGVSGTIDYKKRKLGDIMKQIKKGDTIIVCELSRLGRELFMIMEILHLCMEKDVQVWTIKEGYRLGDNIQSKVLAFAFGLSAEIERNLISMRTKEALARKKAEGVHIGRPQGSKTADKYRKLYGKEGEIRELASLGVQQSKMAWAYQVSRHTMRRYMREKGIKVVKYSNSTTGNTEYDIEKRNLSYEEEKHKLYDAKDKIKTLIKRGVAVPILMKKYSTSRYVMDKFLKENNINIIKYAKPKKK